jgi:hypothetical protein
MTNDEQKNLKDLNVLIRELEAAEALYGAALDGLSKDIDTDIRELEEDDLDGRMARAEEDIAGMAATALQADVDEMGALEQELVEDDADEESALRDDEADPEERGRQLQSEGETE